MAKKNQTTIPFLPAIRQLLQLAGQYKPWFFTALVADIIQAILIVVQNHVLRGVFDAAVAGSLQDFWVFLRYFLGVSLASVPLSFLRAQSLGLFSEHTLATIRRKVAARMRELPVSYMEERHSGDFLSVINADLGKVKTLTGADLLNLVGQVCRGLGALGYIFFVSWH